MASVNFYLEKRRDQNHRIKRENVPVLMYFSYDGKRLQMNTGVKTDFEKWDSERQKVSEKVSQSTQLNGILTSMADDIMSIYRNAKEIGIVPGNIYLREKLKNRKIRSGHKFFDIYIKFIEENNEKWSIYTFRKIQTNYRHMREFSDKSGYYIDFELINQDFFEKYIQYFQHKNHTNSTISRNLDVLKWFLNWATKKGFNTNMYYRVYRFPWEHSYKSDPSDQYLTWEELMCLYQAELPDNRQCKARDIFCFICFTGLKHSQLKSLSNKDHIINKLKLHTHNKRSIPFQKYIHNILEKYYQESNVMKGLPYIRMVSLNSHIKIAGRNAGLFRPVKIRIHHGNEKLTRDIPIYKLLSAKMARNTFIFHSLRQNIPLQYILYVTGLKTLHGIRRFSNILLNNEK